MKKYQIFKQVNGQSAKPYKYAVYDTKEEVQVELRANLKLFVLSNFNNYYHLINSPDFDRYSYDNWTEFIEEIEVDDEN